MVGSVHWHQEQVSKVMVMERNNHISQYTVRCNYFSMPQVNGSGTKVINFCQCYEWLHSHTILYVHIMTPESLSTTSHKNYIDAKKSVYNANNVDIFLIELMCGFPALLVLTLSNQWYRNNTVTLCSRDYFRMWSKIQNMCINGINIK